MLVEQLIRQLEQYPKHAELYVEYWDKETVEAMEDTTLTDDEWADVVYEMEEADKYPSTQEAFSMFIQEIKVDEKGK